MPRPWQLLLTAGLLILSLTSGASCGPGREQAEPAGDAVRSPTLAPGPSEDGPTEEANSTPTAPPSDAGGDGPANEFPVNERFAAGLTNQGVPVDLAGFFAAARMEATSPEPNVFAYHLFYPNGAVRELTLKFTPNQQYTPTPEETAKASLGGSPVYGFTYANNLGSEWTGRLDMSFIVPNGGVPPELLSSLTAASARQLGLPKVWAADGSTSGVTVQWSESAKEGADVAIGSVLDYYKDKGVKGAGKLGAIYGLASALSDVAGAADIAKQNGKWLAELAELEDCAAHPTSQVARNDPNYREDAVAKVQAARSELKEANAVRFLNQMTDTGSGITPATAVMAVALKQGFLWADQTLSDFSENTIMREARLAVVPCKDTPPPATSGNVRVHKEREITWGSGPQVDKYVEDIESTVMWVWNPMLRQYNPQGTFTFSRIESSTANGKTCTATYTATGILTLAPPTGSMQVFDDPAAAAILGYGYLAAGEAPVTTSATYAGCGAGPFVPTRDFNVNWLPGVKGFIVDDIIQGDESNLIRNDSPRNAPDAEKVTLKYAFAVPHAE